MKLRIAIGALIWSLAMSSTACTIGGLEHEVRFDPGSKLASASEVRSLAAWYIDRRDGPQGIMTAHVYAIWPQSVPKAEQIASERASQVLKIIESLSDRDGVPASKYVSMVDDGPREAGAFETIVVGTQPMCLKTKSCCV